MQDANKGVKPGEALEVFESPLPAIADTNIIEIAQQAEKRLDALLTIKRVALKHTNRNDWVDENGKPYLQASGAEKIAGIFGVSWRISEPEVENLDGGHYMFTYKGDFALGGVIIQAIGTRSSKDPFFKKYEYKGDVKKELPASEIDRGDVKKSAFSNLIVNGVTRLLGLRNLAWQDLEQYARINQADVTSVTFKKGGKSQPGSQGSKPGRQEEKQPIDPTTPATEAQVKAIHAIMRNNLDITDELDKAQKAQAILGLKEAPTSMTKLTKGQASTVIDALQKEIEGGE